MRSVTTRDLSHKAKEIREAVARGEIMQWVSRGEVVAFIQPARPGATTTQKDWLAAARKAGAIAASPEVSISQSVYDDRG